jgi:F-type H+-transporting ATPase subunit b
MENFTNIFMFLAHESQGIEFNTNIFETNIINLLLLIALVFYVGKDFLGSTLTSRQNLILDRIEEADKKVNEADKRFLEARLQWSQASILSENLEKRTLARIEAFHELQNSKNKEALLREYFSTLIALDLKNEQVQKQVRNYVIELALIEVYGTFNKLLTNKKFQENYSNYSVLSLEKLIGDK